MVGILFLSFIIKMILSFILTVHGDEGMYLYDASLILKGLRPHVDFHTRSPVYITLLSMFMALFGQSVFVGRLLSAIASSITTIFVYKIGKQLFSERVGFISLVLFSLSPFTLMWSVIIATEVIQIMFLTISVYLVTRFLQEDRPSFQFILPGLIIGLSIFVRRTSMIVLCAEILMILGFFWIKIEREAHSSTVLPVIKNSLTRVIFILTGSFLIFLPIFLFIAHGRSFEYAIDSFFSNAGVGGTGKGEKFVVFNDLIQRAFYFILPTWIFLLISVQGLLGQERTQQGAFNNPSLLSLIGLAALPLLLIPESIILAVLYLSMIIIAYIHFIPPDLISIPGPSQEIESQMSNQITRSPMTNQTTQDQLPILLSLIMVLTVLYTKIDSVMEVQSLFFVVAIFCTLVVLHRHTSIGKKHSMFLWLVFYLSFPIAFGMSADFKSIIITTVISLSTLGLFLLYLEKPRILEMKMEFSHLVILFWFSLVFLFYSYYSMSQEIFIYELSAVLCIISGVVYHHVFPQDETPDILSKVIVSLVVISFISAPFFYVDYEQDTTITKPWTVDEVAHYIEENTEPDEEIFTAHMAIAIEADRPIVMNLSHPTIYCKDYVHGFPDFSVIDYPTPEAIIQYLDDNEVRYIVNDPLTNYYYFMFNDGLREYVLKNYVPVLEVNDVQILLRSKEGDYRLTSTISDASLPFIEAGHSDDQTTLIGYRDGGMDQENIFFRTAAGTDISPKRQVTPVSQSHSHQSHGMVGSQGNSYIVWSENTSSYSNIFLSIFSTDGDPLIEPFPITSNDEMGTNALAPVMTMDSKDRIFIFWSWASSREGYYDLYYSVLDPNGTSLSGNIPLTNDLANNFNPSVGIDENDRIHLVWQDGQDGTYRIEYGSYLFDDDSNQLVEQAPHQVISSDGDSVNPDISVAGDRIDVVWANSIESYEQAFHSIRYITLDPTGQVIIPEQQLTFRYSSEIQEENRLMIEAQNPKVSSNGNVTIVVWQDDRWQEQSDLVFWGYERDREDYDARYWNVYYKVLNKDGMIQTNDTILSYYESNSMYPDIAIDGNDIHVVWADDIMGHFQIMHRRIEMNS